MSNFTEEQVNAVWAKGRQIPGFDFAKYRLDAAGALIARDEYGKEDIFGWEVDHVFPKAKLEMLKVKAELWDDLRNLRPMNAKNNASKGDDYPDYKASYEYDSRTGMNKEVNQLKKVNSEVQMAIAEIFGLDKIQPGK